MRARLVNFFRRIVRHPAAQAWRERRRVALAAYHARATAPNPLRDSKTAQLRAEIERMRQA